MRKLQVVIVPFNAKRGGLEPAGHEPARSTEAGISKAEKMASRYAGVGVYGIWVDDVTFDACDLHELARFGKVPGLDELQAAA